MFPDRGLTQERTSLLVVVREVNLALTNIRSSVPFKIRIYYGIMDLTGIA
jgi:hypothetical protein